MVYFQFTADTCHRVPKGAARECVKALQKQPPNASKSFAYVPSARLCVSLSLALSLWLALCLVKHSNYCYYYYFHSYATRRRVQGVRVASVVPLKSGATFALRSLGALPLTFNSIRRGRTSLLAYRRRHTCRLPRVPPLHCPNPVPCRGQQFESV